ncbi:hypothetical protein GGI07_002820 [Coemansia sp. Benny D115]|nr:hypothetical protein GGI07_002820 [Coemansia sp. Benny D115]
MGVPGLLRWLQKQFPTACQTLSRLETTAVTQSLFIDLNSALHDNVLHTNGNITGISHKIEQIVKEMRPHKLLYLAIDGVPPRIKERLQRERRANHRANAQGGKRDRLSRSVVTPGTDWMRRVEEHLVEFIETKRAADPQWRDLRVVLSGCRDAGEGEHKIMRYLRAQHSEDTIDSSANEDTGGVQAGMHCVWSNDADSVLLSLATRVPRICLVGERQVNGVGSYTLVNIDRLVQAIYRMYGPQTYEDSAALTAATQQQIQRLIDDLVFMTFFAGNDFLPALAFMRKRAQDESMYVHALWSAYRKLAPEHQCLHKRGRINLPAFRALLDVLAAEGEMRVFREHVGVTALGAQMTALRIRRMEWETQRKAGGPRPDEAAGGGGGGVSKSGKRKKRKPGALVPYVWSGSVQDLAQAGPRLRLRRIAQSAEARPLSAAEKVEYHAPQAANLAKAPAAAMLTVDGHALLCPSLVGPVSAMYAVATRREAAPTMIEVDGGLSSSRIRWLESLARSLGLECVVRGMADPSYNEECQRWKRRRRQHTPATPESETESALSIVIGDLKVCVPTCILRVTSRPDRSTSGRTGELEKMQCVVCSNDDWDVLLADAKVDHRHRGEHAGWKRTHYEYSYFKGMANDQRFVENLCEHYANALGWTAQYYFDGHVGCWHFAWPDIIESAHGGTAPLESDMAVFLDRAQGPKAQWTWVPASDVQPPGLLEHMLSVMPQEVWARENVDALKADKTAAALMQGGYSSDARMHVRQQLAHCGAAETDSPLVYIWQ